MRENNVDIVSMSLGFDRTLESVETEITQPSAMLFFAAANNDGLNSPELFPANFDRVISVRGTSPNGAFNPQYNPSTPFYKRECCYGTLATDVSCGGPDDTRLVKSGCSVATPIMVAIAAALLLFVDGAYELQECTYRSRIRKPGEIQRVFQAMTQDQQQGERRYLAPWQLLYNKHLHPREIIKPALV